MSEHAALVTKERPRIEDDESSDNGSWFCHDEDDDIGSEGTSDGEFLPEDRPERSYSKIEGLGAPPQHWVKSEKVDSESVEGDRTQDFQDSDITPNYWTTGPSTYDFEWKPNMNPQDLHKLTRATDNHLDSLR